MEAELDDPVLLRSSAPLVSRSSGTAVNVATADEDASEVNGSAGSLANVAVSAATIGTVGETVKKRVVQRNSRKQPRKEPVRLSAR